MSDLCFEILFDNLIVFFFLFFFLWSFYLNEEGFSHNKTKIRETQLGFLSSSVRVVPLSLSEELMAMTILTFHSQVWDVLQTLSLFQKQKQFSSIARTKGKNKKYMCVFFLIGPIWEKKKIS